MDILFLPQYKKMPWLSIPAEGTAEIKQNLANLLGIQGIPTLVILDAKTGEFITAEARNQVEDAGGDPLKAKVAINEWKRMPRQPISEASKNMPGVNQNPLMKIIMFFAKNPIYVFGLMYFYKYLTKQMKIWYPEAYPDEVGDDEDAVPEADASATEF